MAVYSYARVSTASQADKGGSVASQREQCSGYAKMKGLEEPLFFADEGVSGSTRAILRPSGGRLLAELKSGDHLIVSKVDRLFRSARDALNVVGDFAENGTHLHIIELGGLIADSEPMPKMFLAFLGIMAEWELSKIKERIAEGKARAKAERKFAGGNPPYGWRPGEFGVLEPDPDQQLVLMELKRMFRDGRVGGDGGMSIRKTAEYLTGLHGIPISRRTVGIAVSELADMYKNKPKAVMKREIGDILGDAAGDKLAAQLKKAARARRPQIKYRVKPRSKRY